MPDTSLTKRILALAIPSLGALIAEPLFLLTDTAMVGHLGAEALASLGLASTILTTVIGLLIFLAYATTPIVARRLGSGNRPGAISAGIDGLWLALGLGVVLGILGYAITPLAVSWFGAVSDVSAGAVSYLTISWWGLPGMLLVIAATGLMRGLQDARTPLWIALAGFASNAVLNAVLIYGLGWGLVGSAVGTVIAQWGMAAVFVALLTREARTHEVSLAPGVLGIQAAARSGSWLLLRTLSLRLVLIATVVVATGLGTRELAAWHIVFTIFGLLALALDALAIAAQALVGHDLGSGDLSTVRHTTSTLIAWGFFAGGMLAILMGLLSPLLPFVMTSARGAGAGPGVAGPDTPTLRLCFCPRRSSHRCRGRQVPGPDRDPQRCDVCPISLARVRDLLGGFRRESGRSSDARGRLWCQLHWFESSHFGASS